MVKSQKKPRVRSPREKKVPDETGRRVAKPSFNHIAERRWGVTATGRPKQSALYDAILLNDVPAVHRLIECGVEVTQRNANEKTPVEYAASLGAYDICQALITKGGARWAARINRDTALHIAVAGGYQDLCDLFLSHGADVTLTNKEGESVVDVALRLGHTSMIDQLRHAQVLASSHATVPDNFPVSVTSEARVEVGQPYNREPLGSYYNPYPTLDLEYTSGYIYPQSMLGRSQQVETSYSWPALTAPGTIFPFSRTLAKLREDLEQEYFTKQVNLKQHHLALQKKSDKKQAQLAREVEKWKGAIAKKSELVDALKVQVESLTRQMKPQAEADATLRKEVAKVEQDHLEKHAQLELELEEWKAVVAAKSLSEGALKVEVESLKQKIESEAIAEDARQQINSACMTRMLELSSQLRKCEEERGEAVASASMTKVLVLTAQLQECQAQKDAAIVSFGNMENDLAGVLEELLDKSTELSELQGKMSAAEVKSKAVLEGVMQNSRYQLETVRTLLDFANNDLEEAKTCKREMTLKIENLELDVKRREAAEERATKAEKALGESEQYWASRVELAERNAAGAKQRVTELEEALLAVKEKQTSVEACNVQQIESSKQEAQGMLYKVASLERKLARRTQRIDEMVQELEVASEMYEAMQQKLQATKQKLKEERKANEAKMDTTVQTCNASILTELKRTIDEIEMEGTSSCRKKAKCAPDTEETGGNAAEFRTTYCSSYDTWYQNLLYCVNMMIAAKGGSTGKWPLIIERASNEKMALNVLDKMMHSNALKAFFKPFEVKMTNAADQKGKKKKKESTMEHGWDAGGLTNDLLGKVFNGLLEVKVNVLGTSHSKLLFADDEKAAWALPLEDREVTAEAAILYEGVGRLFLKAILSGANTEADTPTLIPDTVFNPCFLHLCLDRGITKSDAGNCMMSSEDVRDALESLLPPDHFGLWSTDALIDKSATMNWATGDDADADILVSHDNHDMYGRKFLERILSTRKVAFEHMKKGFFLTIDHERHGYIPPLKFFNSKQRRVLLCGKIVKPELILSTLNFVDGNHPDETGGEIGHAGDSWAAANMRDTKQWLLEFISKLNAQECEDFLNYCAAVVRIPYARSHADGGEQSNFQIHVIARGGTEQQNALPSAQTCFRKLSLPAYTSYNELQKAFKVAFEHAGGYFGKE